MENQFKESSRKCFSAYLKKPALNEQCKLASESNNMTINKQFTKAVKGVTKECPVSVMMVYTEQLDNAINSFEIFTIGCAYKIIRK